jgi:hypothetical protein
MRRSIRSTLVALLIVPAVSTAGAQALTTVSSAPRANVTELSCCRSSLTVEEEKRLVARISEADRAMVEGRFIEARATLRQVIDAQVGGGVYPAPALRRLANVEFALDRPSVAASVLEELAAAANQVGDPQTELDALVDAMIIHAQDGRKSKALALRPRALQLLDSPAIPVDTRRSLARHLNHEQ